MERVLRVVNTRLGALDANAAAIKAEVDGLNQLVRPGHTARWEREPVAGPALSAAQSDLIDARIRDGLDPYLKRLDELQAPLGSLRLP